MTAKIVRLEPIRRLMRDDLSPDERDLIRLYSAMPPEARAAFLTLMRYVAAAPNPLPAD